jgi:hypothetical protein
VVNTLYIQSLTVNGSNVLPPEGSGDPESPFPDRPPLDIGWKKRGFAGAFEWKLRAFDEVSAIGLYVIEHGSKTWRNVAESGIIKAGDPWAEKGSYVP